MNSKKAILEEVIPMRQYQRRKLRIAIQLTRFWTIKKTPLSFKRTETCNNHRLENKYHRNKPATIEITNNFQHFTISNSIVDFYSFYLLLVCLPSAAKTR